MSGHSHRPALSTREGEVARLYVDGLTYKEIARDLEISPATVRTHLNKIYRKLEVTSRIELLHRLAGHDSARPTAPAPAEPVVQRRQVTVMFVDLAGSTALAAGMDAEAMHALLQDYRQAVRRVVEAAGGHAAGFPGDGVVACFGWPDALEDAAERAVRAGLEVPTAIGRIRAPDGHRLVARVGIAMGVVVVDGSKGDAQSLIGGTPNRTTRPLYRPDLARFARAEHRADGRVAGAAPADQPARRRAAPVESPASDADEAQPARRRGHRRALHRGRRAAVGSGRREPRGR